MIKINLALRKESGLVTQSKPLKNLTSINLGLGTLSTSDLKEIQFRKLIIPVLVCVVGYFGLESFKEKQIEEVSAAVTKQLSENARLQESIKKFKTYDALKTSLDEDEQVIRTKLETIQKLAQERNYVSDLLISISKTIPRDVWLTQLAMEKAEIQFVGNSLGYTPISDFMKTLNESTSLKEVTLKGTQQSTGIAVASPGGPKTNLGVGSEITNFQLQAKRR